MRRSGWSWRFAAGLVLVAALAQACGGSSQSSGPGGNRVELWFTEAQSARLGLLPTGCDKVEILIPGNTTVVATDTQVTLLLSPGPHTAVGTLFCGTHTFTSNTAQFEVPPGLRSIDVALVFGGVNVLLTVRVGPGVSVKGDTIACPGDCTQTFFAGTSVKLTANNPAAVFTGGCNGTGSCIVLLNQDKTVFVRLSVPALDSFIQVINDTCCGDIDVFIDDVLVANNLPEGGSVKTKVSPGDHVVQGDCGEGGPTENVNVSPGETEVVELSCD